jgi:galactose mutarotase-like enzyme
MNTGFAAGFERDGTLGPVAVLARDGAGEARRALEATEDFSHLVLSTPRGERFFCFENQTCSTDAHDLFARGFAEPSGLESVAPGAVHRGAVRQVESAIG